MGTRRARWLLGAATAIWVLALVAGIVHYHSYSTRRGAVARTGSPMRWPSSSSLVRSESTPTLVMFAHAECPCTRASLRELADALPRTAARILVVVRGDASELVEPIARISGAIAIADTHDETARFGAQTSGYTVVYDAAGRLRFAGGITGSRGHVGVNMGRIAVRAVLSGAEPAVAEHAVFGCALEDS